MLAGKNPHKQLKAAEILGQIGGERALELLVQVLQDEQAGVPRAAAEAMLSITCNWARLEVARSIIPALVEALTHTDEVVREAAVETLGQMRARETSDHLILRLTDTDEHVRWAAAKALGQIGEKAAIGPLALTLTDTYEGVRKTVAKVLRRIDPEWVHTEAARSVIPVLKERLRSTIPVLKEHLRVEDWQTCEAAAKVLKELGWQPVDVDDYALTAWDDIAALAEKSVEQLITKARNRETGSVAVAALEKGLGSNSTYFSEKHLAELAVLQDIVEVSYDLYSDSSSTVVDASRVRHLAQLELSRRRPAVSNNEAGTQKTERRKRSIWQRATTPIVVDLLREQERARLSLLSLPELLQEKREAILDLATRCGASNVRIFGSVARGEADAESDIDFLVDQGSMYRPQDVLGLQRGLQELLGRQVDVVIATELHSHNRARVLREAIKL